MKPAAAPKRETITRSTPHPNGQAWQWGYDAACDGYPDTCCPFHTGTPSAVQWIAGHAAGLESLT